MNSANPPNLIDALGSANLAHALGLNLSTVCNWRQRGVPHRWRPAVAKLARKKRVRLPDDFILYAETQLALPSAAPADRKPRTVRAGRS